MSSLPFGWGGKGNTFILFFANLFKLFFEVFFTAVLVAFWAYALLLLGFPLMLSPACLLSVCL
jgi:hypothetical protein